jgi:hypothetical protein
VSWAWSFSHCGWIFLTFLSTKHSLHPHVLLHYVLNLMRLWMSVTDEERMKAFCHC